MGRIGDRRHHRPESDIGRARPPPAARRSAPAGGGQEPLASTWKFDPVMQRPGSRRRYIGDLAADMAPYRSARAASPTPPKRAGARSLLRTSSRVLAAAGGENVDGRLRSPLPALRLQLSAAHLRPSASVSSPVTVAPSARGAGPDRRKFGRMQPNLDARLVAQRSRPRSRRPVGHNPRQRRERPHDPASARRRAASAQARSAARLGQGRQAEPRPGRNRSDQTADSAR